MCRRPHHDEELQEKPVATQIRLTLSSAVYDALITAALVLLITVVGGAPAPLVALGTVGAFVLAVVVHELVILARIGSVRTRESADEPTPEVA